MWQYGSKRHPSLMLYDITRNGLSHCLLHETPHRMASTAAKMKDVFVFMVHIDIHSEQR